MRGLFRYLLRNYAFLLFILLEVFSLVLVFNYNSFQKAKYLNSANHTTASIYNSFNSVVIYFGLANVNRELAVENARLKSLIQNNPNFNVLDDSFISELNKGDSTFRFISARVINNSVNKQRNYITLNKGRKHGVKPDQGIISTKGIVGVVIKISESYSMGLSVLNQRWAPSVKLKKSGSFGPLSWDGKDFQFADLMGIPFHVQLDRGDTIVTSSFSYIFPEGIMVGTVDSFFKPDGENYYNIKVKLAADFKALSFVQVIDNLDKTEIKELEILTKDD